MDIPWRDILPNGGRLFLGGGASVPFHLVDRLLEQAEAFQDVEWMHIHTVGDMPWLDEQYRGHFRTNSFFLTHKMWDAVNTGHADYTPCPMSDVPRLFDEEIIPVDVALIQVSPPDENGMVSLGVSADVLCSVLRHAKTIVAQINRHVPATYGDSVIPLDSIHYQVEHHAPLAIMREWIIDERYQKMGEYAAQLIDDGSTIQASLGTGPQAVLRALRHHRQLGIHTGCFTDPMMELMQLGVVTNCQKEYQTGISVATHCLGSQALYDFVDGNRDIEMHGSEWANAPHRIARHRKMVAINGAREVDLTGQVVRDSRGHRFYGGIGATQDFIRGATGSKDGRPIIVLASTRGDDSSSRIVTGLSSGSGVCTSRGDVHYVVTEHGVATLVGQSIRQRVLRLVEIAHPKFQESLLEGARGQGWIPQIFAAPTPSHIRDESDTELEIKKVDFSGIEYVVRPLHPSDMRALQEFFYAQDEETIRLRYGHAIPALDEQTAYRMVSVDQSTDLALGVFYRNHFREDLRGVGRFYSDPGGESAEVAFLVHERARRKGIAQYLLSEIAKIAQERGIEKFWASVLKGNVPMAQLFKNCGATRSSQLGEDSDEYWMDTQALASREIQKPTDSDTAAAASSQKKIGVYYSERLLAHDTGADHPESIQRYRTLCTALDQAATDFTRIDTQRLASVAEVLRVHSASYHDLAKIDIEQEYREVLRTGDTAVCEDSYHVVMQALGGVLQAGDEVMSGQLDRAFCAIRPPGHHATVDRGMGFCIFNHVTILARHLQAEHGLQRIAILDWDVHHGNGTQDIFYESGDVLFISSHQEGIFPHSGLASETGSGDGEGATVNYPLPMGTADAELVRVWQEQAIPRVEAFVPEAIIISAGFDAATEDPLADLLITESGFRQLTRSICELADRICGGRVISVLEGGYHPETLAQCVLAHVEELRG